LNSTQLHDQEEEREQYKENEKQILQTYNNIIKSFGLFENTTYFKIVHKQTQTTNEPFIFYHNNYEDDVKEKLSYETLTFCSFFSFNLSFILLLTILIRWFLILSKFKTQKHLMEYEEKVIFCYFPTFYISLSKSKACFFHGILKLSSEKISDITFHSQGKEATAKDALMLWVNKHLDVYPNIKVKDFSHSWKDGKALLGILNRHM
jgi:hypothetical protein